MQVSSCSVRQATIVQENQYSKIRCKYFKSFIETILNFSPTSISAKLRLDCRNEYSQTFLSPGRGIFLFLPRSRLELLLELQRTCDNTVLVDKGLIGSESEEKTANQGHFINPFLLCCCHDFAV
jgi:hypothetical protein